MQRHRRRAAHSAAGGVAPRTAGRRSVSVAACSRSPRTPWTRLPARVYWTPAGCSLLGMACSSWSASRGCSAARDAAPSATAAPGGRGRRRGPRRGPTVWPRRCSDRATTRRRRAAQARQADAARRPVPAACPPARAPRRGHRGDARRSRTPVAGRAGDASPLDLTTQTLDPRAPGRRQRTTVTLVDRPPGSDRIWSSRSCPRAIAQHVVVIAAKRPRHQVTVVGPAAARTRAARGRPWAQPGWYHVHGRRPAGGPTDEQFRLSPPRPATVTRTPKPHKPSRTSGTACAAPCPSRLSRRATDELLRPRPDRLGRASHAAGRPGQAAGVLRRSARGCDDSASRERPSRTLRARELADAVDGLEVVDAGATSSFCRLPKWSTSRSTTGAGQPRHLGQQPVAARARRRRRGARRRRGRAPRATAARSTSSVARAAPRARPAASASVRGRRARRAGSRGPPARARGRRR